MSDKVIYNEKEISKDELEKLKESVKDDKSVEVVEVSKDEYKTRLKG